MQPDNKEAEPETLSFLRRCTLFRRMVSKKPELLVIVQTIFDEYAKIDYIGIFVSNAKLAGLNSGPPVGHRLRPTWKPGVNPQGPIGLMFLSAHF